MPRANPRSVRRLCLSVNGALSDYEEGIDLAALLARHGLSTQRLAVEHNGEIVPRSRHRDTCLADGDRIEIVIAVGGG